MSSENEANGTWLPGEPPKDGKYHLCWCRFEYPRSGETEQRPIVLRWKIWGDRGEWAWDDQEYAFWGTIEFHAGIKPPPENPTMERIQP